MVIFYYDFQEVIIITHRETKKETKQQDNKSKKPEITREENMDKNLPQNSVKTNR